MTTPDPYTRADAAADELTRRVMERTGATNRTEVECPRARSWMTPCVARDGYLAVQERGKCLGCGRRPARLLDELDDRT